MVACPRDRQLALPHTPSSGSTASPGSLAASPRFDFGVSPNCASRRRKWLALLFYFIRARKNNSGEAASWSLLVGAVLAIAAVVVVGVGNLRHPALSFTDSLGLTSPDLTPVSNNPESVENDNTPNVDWPSALSPRGTKTRNGDAIQYLVTKERGVPVAGIVVYTDGRSN